MSAPCDPAPPSAPAPPAEELAELAASVAVAAAAPGCAAAAPVRFRRNRRELLWLGCVLLLGITFSVTIAGVLLDRLTASSPAEQHDLLLEGMGLAACIGIFIVVGLVGREPLRFWRREVVIDGRGLRVGSVALPWDQVALLREAREFRAGEWFYHLEIRGRSGERTWVTSGLIADYPAFRAELLRRRPKVPLMLLPD